jgi:NitT/TauT family transport system ATP-binding protein
MAVQVDDGTSVNGSRAQTQVAVSALSLEVVYSGAGRQTHALGPLSLDVAAGEFVSIVGPSGCGKSTFIRVIAGIVEPTAGRVDICRLDPNGSTTATVFQDFGIFPWKTVQANVEFGLRILDVPKKEARKRASDWIARIGLADFAHAYPAELSGGMRQRVSIARAMAVEPAILLMDEPFASLDAQLREILQDELLTITQSEKRTIIFVTHSLEEALILSDRLVVMSARPGQIREEQVVPFERPRASELRETPEFQALRLELWEGLRAEVQAQLRGKEGEPR